MSCKFLKVKIFTVPNSCEMLYNFSGDACEDEEDLDKSRQPSKYSYVNQFPIDMERLEAAQAAKTTRQRPNTPPQVC